MKVFMNLKSLEEAVNDIYEDVQIRNENGHKNGILHSIEIKVTPCNYFVNKFDIVPSMQKNEGKVSWNWIEISRVVHV